MYRDVTVATPLLVQLWLFASPIVYPSSLIPGDWQLRVRAQPDGDGDRRHALGVPRRGRAVARRRACASLAGAIAMLAAGVVYFRRTERFFADVV